MTPEGQPPRSTAAPPEDPAAPQPGSDALSERLRRLKATDVIQGAGAAAASTALIYVVGGMVMWLRFRKAGLPADQAVALMERQQLLVIGLRLMVLPAAMTGVFAWILLRRQPADPDAMTRAQLRWRAAAKTVLVVLAIAIALTLPFSFASATWVLAALLIVGYMRYERRPPSAPAVASQEPASAAPPLRGGVVGRLLARSLALLRVARNRAAAFGPGRPFQRRRKRGASPWVVTTLVVLVAALVSLGRQLDQPVQLPSASVTVKGATETIDGTFISADATDVFVGANRQIQAVPRATIDLVRVGPPRERAPSPSIASRLLGGGAYATTPFEWWCNGERYTWGEVGDLCQTQLRLFDDSMGFDGKSHVPVKLTCPTQARRPCQGVIRLVSRHRYVLGPAGLPRPVVLGAPVRAAGAPASASGVEPGRTIVVCVPVDSNQRGLLRNAIPAGQKVPDKIAFFDLSVLSDTSDDEGNVTLRDRYAINVPPPSLTTIPEFGDCGALR